MPNQFLAFRRQTLSIELGSVFFSSAANSCHIRSFVAGAALVQDSQWVCLAVYGRTREVYDGLARYSQVNGKEPMCPTFLIDPLKLPSRCRFGVNWSEVGEMGNRAGLKTCHFASRPVDNQTERLAQKMYICTSF